MNRSRILVLVLATVSLVGIANWVSGCGTSSTGGANSVVTASGFTNCTTVTSTSSQNCIPGLVSPIVEFQGPANITNTGEAKYFIRSFPQYAGAPINTSQVQTALIDVTINSTTSTIQVSVLFPQFSPTWFTGYSTFNVLTGSSNPNVGQMLMTPLTPLGTSFGVSTLTQPWDGSVPYLSGVTVSIDAVKAAGTAALQRIQ